MTGPDGKLQPRLQLHVLRILIEQGFVDRHCLPLLIAGTADDEMLPDAGNVQIRAGTLAAGEKLRVIIRIDTGDGDDMIAIGQNLSVRAAHGGNALP